MFWGSKCLLRRYDWMSRERERKKKRWRNPAVWATKKTFLLSTTDQQSALHVKQLNMFHLKKENQEEHEFLR